MMHNPHPRPDVLALLAQALDTPEHPVSSGEDERLDASTRPHTVVQTRPLQHGRYSRWSFRVHVTLTTFASSSTTAYDAHTEVADRLLELNYLGEANDWFVSAVVCEMEPVNIAGQSAPGWDGQTSTYEFFLRHKGGGA